MRSILVTGGAGFLGGNMLPRLRQAYPAASLVVLDILDPTCANVKNVPAEPGVVLVKGDIRSFDLVTHLLHFHAIDLVIHLAALTHVDASLAGNSLDFSSVNTLGTHVMLEAVRQYGRVQRMVVACTDEVFGFTPDGEPPRDEQAPFRPTNPYASSKVGQAAMVMSYVKSHRLPCIVTYANNFFGPRQSLEKLLPKFIQLCLMGRPLPVHGDGTQKRCFLHVDDVVDAYLTIIERGELGTSYNIGGDAEYSVLEVASLVQRQFSSVRPEVVHVRNRLFNDQAYRIDCSRLRSLGWTPQRTLEATLPGVIAWYREHPDWWPFDTVQRLVQAHPNMCDNVATKF